MAGATTCNAAIFVQALENLGCTRVSIFSSGGNQPLAEFLDVENPANAIWIKYSGAQG